MPGSVPTRAAARYPAVVRHLALLPLLTASLALVACKGGRAKLEQLVPDGATGMMSVDAKGLLQSALWAKLRASAEAASDGKTKATLDQLRSDCKLDLDEAESVVLGFDALGQGVMGAVRMPNLGTAEALRCVDALVVAQGGKSPWTVGTQDGKATLSIEDGKAQGWALDDDTLVVSTKGWASAVQARMAGEGKGAVDGFLAEAIALTDTGKHLWFAGELPAVVAPLIEGTPAAGVRRVAGSMQFGDEVELAVAAGFGDEAAAKAAHDRVSPMLDEAKPLAIEQGLPKAAADSMKLEHDGSALRMTMTVDLVPLFEQSTQAFTRYMSRSKTSEARVQIAKLFDATSSYFNEEHVSRGEVAVIGAGGAIEGLAPHQCPSDGNATGETITPPLSVDCSKGPGGRCVPVSGEPSGPGEYSMRAWTESPVWNALSFQQEQPHFFHYGLKWKNDGTGYGACQFTAQAFGDLDGDGLFSTFERAGAADELGVNAAAGLYIDNELE